MKKGSKHSPEALEKIRAARAKQGPMWNAGIKVGPDSDETRARKSVAARLRWALNPPRTVTTYMGMHTRLRRHWPINGKQCEADSVGMFDCGEKASDHALRKDASEILVDPRRGKRFSRRFEDYSLLCRACHSEYDQSNLIFRDRPKSPSRADHANAKLTEQDVIDIRSRRAAGEKLKYIAADFGVSLSSISKISLNHTWKEEENEDDDSKAI